MAKQQPELGIKSPYRLRLGHNIDRFRGVNREADPGAIGDAELQDAENVRLTASGAIGPRGGQSKVNTSAMDGCIEALFDDELGDDIPRLYWVGGVSQGVLTYSEDQSPNIQSKSVPAEDQGEPVTTYQTYVVLAEDGGSDVDILSLVATRFSPAAVVGDQFTISVATQLRDAVTHDDTLYMLLGAASEAIVYSFDGTVPTLSDSSGVTVGVVPTSARPNLAVLGSNLYYVVPHAADGVVRRLSGGVWSTIATFTNVNLGKLIGYNSKLYLFHSRETGSGHMEVYEVTGGGVTLVHTYDGFVGGATYCLSVCLFGGFLYYFVSHDTTNGVSVGRFNGTTWSDNFATHVLTDSDDLSMIVDVSPDGEAMMSLNTNHGEAVPTTRLFRSNSTGATWTQVTTDLEMPIIGNQRYGRLVLF